MLYCVVSCRASLGVEWSGVKPGYCIVVLGASLGMEGWNDGGGGNEWNISLCREGRARFILSILYSLGWYSLV